VPKLASRCMREFDSMIISNTHPQSVTYHEHKTFTYPFTWSRLMLGSRVSDAC